MTLRSTQREGMALLVVLVLVVMAAMSAYGYAFLMNSQYRWTRLHEQQVHARLAAESGLELVANILEQPMNVRRSLGNLSDNPELFASVRVGLEEEVSRSIEHEPVWRTSIVSPMPVPNAAESLEVMQDQASPGTNLTQRFVFGLENESAKIHLPSLLAWDRERPGHARQVLLSLPGATAPVIDAWLSRLSNQLPSGPELDELWQGFDSNRNYQVDTIELALRSNAIAAPYRNGSTASSIRNSTIREAEMPMAGGAAGSGGEAVGDIVVPTWNRFVTWHSGGRNETPSGRRRIDLNQPDLRELHRQLLEIWTAEQANFAVAFRQYGPSARRRSAAGRVPRSRPAASGGSSSTLGQTNTVSTPPPSQSPAPSTDTMSAQIEPPNFAIPASYQLRSPVELIDAVVEVQDSADSTAGSARNSRKRRMASPFSAEIVRAGNYLNTLLVEVAVDGRASFEGRIDLTEAPLPVLMAIPGMDRALAEAIVSHRSRLAGVGFDQDSGTGLLERLLAEGALDLSRLVSIEPYLTTRSDVYSCQVVGFLDDRSTLFRCTACIDAKVRPAIIRDFQTWHQWDRGFTTDELSGVDLSQQQRGVATARTESMQ
ncbi:MAG: hypothetical protein KF752_13955 [Pirellulaceae bacterium]|nr:hypothetical protein [Pirellulaceae bacterium]